MKRMPALLGATGLAIALCSVSCTTLGTHVKGGFACRAPIGTCAPMSSIDAQAIAGLGGSSGSAMPISTDSIDGQARFITTGGEGVPVRTGERVMRIVFPAHTDGHGIYHEEAVAHVVSERSAWALRPTEAPDAGSLDAAIAKGSPPSNPAAVPVAATAASGAVSTAAPLNLREAAAGLSAPAGPFSEEQAQVAVDMPNNASDMPSAAALAAARDGHRIGDGPVPGAAPLSHVRPVTLHSRRHDGAVRKTASASSGALTAALNRAALHRLAPLASHESGVAVASATVPTGPLGSAVVSESRP